MTSLDMQETFGDPISVYTRAQAIEDGVLVDVSETAREAGIKYPTVITRGAWGDHIALPDGYKGCQDERGRLWDVVWMTRMAIRRCKPGDDMLEVWLYVRRINKDGTDDQRAPRKVKLWAICGPCDDAEPVITIMRPEDC